MQKKSEDMALKEVSGPSNIKKGGACNSRPLLGDFRWKPPALLGIRGERGSGLSV